MLSAVCQSLCTDKSPHKHRIIMCMRFVEGVFIDLLPHVVLLGYIVLQLCTRALVVRQFARCRPRGDEAETRFSFEAHGPPALLGIPAEEEYFERVGIPYHKSFRMLAGWPPKEDSPAWAMPEAGR